MSLLRISEIYGGSQKDIAAVVALMQQSATRPPTGNMITPASDIAERSLALAGTQEDRETSLARLGGCPPKLCSDQKVLVLELVENGQSVRAIARKFNVHIATIYRCINEKETVYGDVDSGDVPL
ncbi:Helix-turn-helix domain of resolvase [Pseudovibrio sp. Tun.PSC04-5.I4]|nr:Helix-turn-helix domain of resolvase [Pseudovibrio sp. Tun.PSC04-5.I4]